MTVRPFQPDDHAELVRLRKLLWPGHSSSDGLPHVTQAVFVIDRGGGKLGGFIEVSLRNVVDGCNSSPAGYIEAWYVDEDLRRRGLGSGLVKAAEDWARSLRCSEMGSDCLVDNETSLSAHRALGYAELDRSINLHKKIAERPAPTLDAPDWIDLSDTPLSATRAVEFVSDARAGGIDVFLGTTRAEDDAGRQLVALDYEAYLEMAVQQMYDLARAARQKWPIVKLALLHRTGRVVLAEPSVIIAVSCPHRGEAFVACCWLIDTLKREVAIWKKEVWADGSATWVEGKPE